MKTMKKYFQEKRVGFTLIELLVVIAIIGVLASVVLASVNTARAKSRDARRRADLSQLRLALELYYNDNGAYPLSAAGPQWYSSETQPAVPTVTTNGGNWIPGLAPTYISLLPREPLPGTGRPQPVCGGWVSAYLYISTGAGYTLLSHCSPEGTWTSSDGFYDTSRPTWAFRVCNGWCT